MKAIFFNQHGNESVLEYGDFTDPIPGPGDLIIRLKSAALNRMDLWVRNGWPGIKLELPHIPGADGAGIIESKGEQVTRWKVGDRVVINSNLGCGTCSYCLAGQDNMCTKWHLLGETVRGTYAEYVCLPERNVYPLPDQVSFREAAASGLVFHTAWHSLITKGNLKAGESVLVVGASGGVNCASIQIAKMAGATVIVIGSTPEKLAFAKSLGADFLIDRTQEENWSKIVYNITQQRGVDVVVDNVGTTFPASFRAARKGGRILTVGNTGGPKIEIDNRYIFGKQLSLIGSTMGTITDFHTVMDMIFSGKLKPVLDLDFPLSDAAQAQMRLEKGEQFGKITLDIQ